MYKVDFVDTTIQDRFQAFLKETRGNYDYSYGAMTMIIDRKNLLKSFLKESDRLRNIWAKGTTFSVKFKGEPGIDCGGPSREFFDLFGTK